MKNSGTVTLGTRGSKLALVQAEHCAGKLRATGLDVEIRVVKTTSEHRPETPLSVIDQRDVFTRQLDEALLSGEIDFAVHSLKDVPTEVPEGISLAAITERHDPSDALVSEERWSIEELPQNSVVATSSLRRRAQLLHHRPDLRVVDIRGNVGTRIRKVREGEADALVLARAGIERLDLSAPYTVIPSEVMLPAVGQGALAVATREDSLLCQRIHEVLDHEPTRLAVRAERAMLNELEGGCRVPVGALGTVRRDEVRLRGIVGSIDGALLYSGEAVGENPEEVGRRLALDLLDQGAAVVLGEIREARKV